MNEATIVHHECPYCGIRYAEYCVYDPDDMTLDYGDTVCPECGALMVPIYKNIIIE